MSWTKSAVKMSVPVVVADPFLFSGLPGKPLASKFLTADKKNLLPSAQEFFCNASVWVPAMKLTDAVKGNWVLASSYAYNLCGMGYATGPWKSMSEYMKTLEIMGAAGTTVFMGTTPSRYRNCAELCTGVRMPTSVSSLTYYHLKYPGGSLLLRVLGSQFKGKLYKIDIPSDDWRGGPFYTWGYIVGVISALICVVAGSLGIHGFVRLTNKRTFSALSLATNLLHLTFV